MHGGGGDGCCQYPLSLTIMATAATSPLYSPGVGARRKNVKLPKLPISAFSPPASGTSEQFPLPPSPSTIHPSALVDAGVCGTVDDWKARIGPELVAKSRGVVLALASADAELIKACVHCAASRALGADLRIVSQSRAGLCCPRGLGSVRSLCRPARRRIAARVHQQPAGESCGRVAHDVYCVHAPAGRRHTLGHLAGTDGGYSRTCQSRRRDRLGIIDRAHHERHEL